MNSRDCCFKFLNWSVSIFPEDKLILKPNEQKLIKVNDPFLDEISRLAIVNILDDGTPSTLVLKLKFICNKATLDKTNKGKNTILFEP